MPHTVAIQGMAGSFHHQAAEELLGTDITLHSCATFAGVFQAVKSGAAEYGMVAVENSLQGSINAVYRLLAREQLHVIGEIFLHIEQCLIAASGGVVLENIQRVLSQAPALAQCELWLERHLPHAVLEETDDTAGSVKAIVKQANPTLGAIAGRQAASRYGGHVIAAPVNDDPHNYTRFFLLCKHDTPVPRADKTSIILQTSHAPGALQRALEVFARHDINLSKLDSHPIPGDAWHYAFYVDFEAGADTPVSKNIFQALKKQGCSITVLGSYPSAPLPAA